MKILIADDHTIMRDGIEALLKESYPFAEITAVSDSVDLLKQVSKKLWDVIITDISMPPFESGLEAVKKIREVSPRTPVIVLSMHAADQYAVRAIKAGASGYLNKNGATLELIGAVNCVLSGKKFVSPEVAHLLADAFEDGTSNNSLKNLSDREFEVFNLLASAKTINAIAKQLHLSANTISTFRSRIFTKMQFDNNMELIKYAVDNHI
jgi:two-component system invasion response regulator UvrY